MKLNSKQVVGVLINDIHLDRGNGDLVRDIFKQLVKVCEEYGTRRIFCGGDVFTNRSGQPLQCLTDWKEILEILTDNNFEFHVIPGNHDKTDSGSEKSYLDIFGDNCVHLYRSGGHVLLDSVRVCFIPYFSDERWLEEFNKLAADPSVVEAPVKILITHMGFDGVVNNDGSRVSSAIKPSLFKDWTGVLIGHYHNASKLADNVVYTGSAYQGNYGETVTDKGFTVIYSDGITKHVQSEFPRYIKEVVDCNDRETLANLLDKYQGGGRDYVRFVFTGKKADCQKINIADIQGKYGIDCKFQCVEECEAIELSESDTVLEYNKRSLTKDFMEFCWVNNIKGEQLKYGLELVKKIVK